MSLIMKNNDHAFCLPPIGRYVATCIGLIDLGIEKYKNRGASFAKVLILWELSNALMPDGKPFTLAISYKANLNAKSKLRILLEGWRGKKFSLGELYGFQLENMLAKPCCLTIEYGVGQDGSKHVPKVVDISPLPTSIPRPELYNTPVSFDLNYYSEREYLALPASIRNKISISKA